MRLRSCLGLATAAVCLLCGPVPASALQINNSLAHFATGGGWKTTWFVYNSGTVSGSAQFNFYGNDGHPIVIPLTNSLSQTILTPASSFSTGLVPPSGLVAIESQANTPSDTQGWSQLVTQNPFMIAFSTFHYQPTVGTAQQGVVTSESRNGLSYVVPYSDSKTAFTAIAMANITAAPVTVNVTFHDVQSGNQFGAGTLNLPAMGHLAFVLAKDSFPIAAGTTGTVEFTTGTPGQLTVLGLIFDATSFAFFSIPPIVKLPPS